MIVKLCRHARQLDPERRPRKIACELGLFGGYPHLSVCKACGDYDGPCRGLGDVVDKVTTATGIKQAVKRVLPDCGCQKRREQLNDAIPIGKE